MCRARWALRERKDSYIVAALNHEIRHLLRAVLGRAVKQRGPIRIPPLAAPICAVAGVGQVQLLLAHQILLLLDHLLETLQCNLHARERHGSIIWCKAVHIHGSSEGGRKACLVVAAQAIILRLVILVLELLERLRGSDSQLLAFFAQRAELLELLVRVACRRRQLPVTGPHVISDSQSGAVYFAEQ
jgi:hypothetical protein